MCVVMMVLSALLALGCFWEGPGLLSKIQPAGPRAKQACLSLTLTCFTLLLRFASEKVYVSPTEGSKAEASFQLKGGVARHVCSPYASCALKKGGGFFIMKNGCCEMCSNVIVIEQLGREPCVAVTVGWGLGAGLQPGAGDKFQRCLCPFQRCGCSRKPSGTFREDSGPRDECTESSGSQRVPCSLGDIWQSPERFSGCQNREGSHTAGYSTAHRRAPITCPR